MGEYTRVTQSILLDGCCLPFEEILHEKMTSVYILKPCQEMGQSLEESLRGGKLYF